MSNTQEQDVLVCVGYEDAHSKDSVTGICSGCGRMIWVSASGRVEAERLNLRLVCEHCLPENGILAATASQLLAASLRLTATKPRRTWEERIQYLVAALWETTVVECRSPEDAVCNVICDGCGLLTAATIREPPAGWHIGGLGESDYCPECRTEAT